MLTRIFFFSDNETIEGFNINSTLTLETFPGLAWPKPNSSKLVIMLTTLYNENFYAIFFETTSTTMSMKKFHILTE